MTEAAPSLFRDQVTGEVNIFPTWVKTSSTAESSTQTGTLKTKEREVQTTVSSMQVGGGGEAQQSLDKATETVGPQAGEASLAGLQYVYHNSAAYDEERLATFLESKRDNLLAILSKNAKTASMFEHYQPNWSRKSNELTAVFTLTSPHAVESDLHALDVSWNASGTMIAVAYGRMDTSGWCYNNGYVCVWNLMRPDVDSSNPHYTLETDTYATAVAFHPQESLVLAVGTYSGEVVVFPNITDTIPKEYSSAAGGATLQHQEPVTTLQWLRSPQATRESQRFLLCSGSLDGQMLYWSPANRLAGPVAAFGVRNRRHATVGVTAVAHLFQEQAALGGKRAAKVPNVGAPLLLGLESGEVGRGQAIVPMTVDVQTATAVTPLPLDWAEGHLGPVQAVSPSPFFRHLFATCSSDGAAHIHSDLERAPLLTLEPSAETKHFLYDVEFSPFRPAILGLVSRSSMLLLYDLHVSSARPLYAMEAGVDGSPVVSLSFNGSSADWLATGDARGSVRIWHLPSDVSQPTDIERTAARLEQHAGGKDDVDGSKAKEATRQLFNFSM